MSGGAREKPILFSAPMVRAILAGTKTQTRRLIKNPDYFGCTTGDCPHGTNAACQKWLADQAPFQVGDVLWVRESFYDNGSAGGNRSRFVYAATVEDGRHPPVWKPSIHMPRAACRITLEVTDVRVQRVREISEEDAIAEGVEQHPVVAYIGGPPGVWVTRFARLWDSIHGLGAWERNDWVWAYTFRRLRP